RTPSFLCDTSTTSLYTLSLHDALPIFFVVAQDPPPESEHPTAHGMDREHYPALETIECFGLAPRLFLDNGQARLLQEFQLIALRSEEHTSELQSRENLVCRLLLEKKNN